MNFHETLDLGPSPPGCRRPGLGEAATAWSHAVNVKRANISSPPPPPKKWVKNGWSGNSLKFIWWLNSMSVSGGKLFVGWSTKVFWGPLSQRQESSKNIGGSKAATYTVNTGCFLKKTSASPKTSKKKTCQLFSQDFTQLKVSHPNTASLLEVHGGCLSTTIAWSVARASSASKSSLLPGQVLVSRKEKEWLSRIRRIHMDT